MKRSLIGILSATLVGTAALAQTIPLYENHGVLVTGTNVPPQIDALAFANYGVFSVSSSLPYDFTNVRHYTNRGSMVSTPGFIFDTAFSLGPRVPAEDFVNASGATITAQEGFSLGLGPISAAAAPSYLTIAATNVTAQGILSVSAGGLLRIDGQQVDLTRGGLEVRPIAPGGTFTFPGATNFFPDAGISDLYWASTNDVMTSSTLLAISAIATNVSVPRHTVTNTGGFQGSAQFRVDNPFSFAQTNAVTETNWIVQGIFVGLSDPNLGTEVRLANGPIITNLFKTAIVRLFMSETNVVTGNVVVQNLYLKDDLASNTNYFVAENAQAPGNFRPASYELSRSAPNEWLTGAPPTGDVRPDLFFDNTLSNNFVTNYYAAYSARVSSTPVDVPQVPGFEITDLPGRVEIHADNLKLDRTRIRGNTLVNIQTPNLLSSSNAIVDAPNLNFNLGAIQRVLNVTNLAKATVTRLSGSLRAWSAVWTNNSGMIVTNTEPDATDPTITVTNMVTNVIEIGYHIFVVDARGLQTQSPVVTHDLHLHAPDVVIGDTLNVVDSLLIDATSLTLKSDLTLSSPIDFWRGTNAPNLLYFTNQGTLFVPNAAFFTEGRASPYASFVNEGLIDVTGMTLKTDYFENGGTISAFNDGVNIDMVTGLLQGGMVVAASDVTYHAANLKCFNYTNDINGTLILDVTGGMADNGQGSGNIWTVRRGFQLMQKPQAGDLLGTTIHTIAERFNTVDHIWAGTDPASPEDGFRNNVAIGNLSLDAQADGTLRFIPATGANALFADMLELTNAVLTAFQNDDLGSALEIDPGMKIYFAASNVPADQLDGQLGGRLVWVQSFIGPNSAVDVLMKNGQIVQMNRAVRESTVIDSDGDGLPNAADPYPLEPDAALALMSVQRTTPPPAVSFSWMARPKTVYRVEYRSQLGSGDWEFLTNYTNASTSVATATVQDAVAKGTAQRYYRVRSVDQLK